MKKYVAGYGDCYGGYNFYYDDETSTFTSESYELGSVDDADDKRYSKEEVVSAEWLLTELIMHNQLNSVIKHSNELQLEKNINSVLTSLHQAGHIYNIDFLGDISCTYYKITRKEYVIYYNNSYFYVKNKKCKKNPLTKQYIADFSSVKKILEHKDNITMFTWRYSSWEEYKLV